MKPFSQLVFQVGSLTLIFSVASFYRSLNVVQDVALKHETALESRELMEHFVYDNNNNNHHASAAAAAATTTSAASSLRDNRKRSSSSSSSRSKEEISSDNPDEEKIDFTKLVHESPPWALFYNVFVPNTTLSEEESTAGANSVSSRSSSSAEASSHDIYTPQRDGVENALRIFEEQLTQIKQSFAALREWPFKRKLHVFYNTIGMPLEASDARVQNVCNDTNPLQCIHMKHYKNAFEEVTLQRMWEYCHDFPGHKVLYMHNKGSYNSRRGTNEYWRRHMTAAISHQQCIEPPPQQIIQPGNNGDQNQQTQCDLCGLTFYGVPFIHFSGNFFTAKCSYINKLLPVPEYRRQMEDLATISLRNVNESRLLFQRYPQDDAYLGLGRYASEAWPGSHPDLTACDLAKDPRARTIKWWKRQRAKPDPNSGPLGNMDSLYQVAVAPRPEDPKGDEIFFNRKRLNPSKRYREYFMLAGNILKWKYLYNNQVPGPSSWVWNFFPDAKFWQDAVAEHKEETDVSSSSSKTTVEKTKKREQQEVVVVVPTPTTETEEQIKMPANASKAETFLFSVLERYAKFDRFLISKGLTPPLIGSEHLWLDYRPRQLAAFLKKLEQQEDEKRRNI